MKFIADLHIHSPFSRATSKASNLTGLAAWASIKGIDVIGTGDFTHPGWFSLLKEQLIPAEPGLYKLKNETFSAITEVLSAVNLVDDSIISRSSSCRFLLTAEISSIYKRHGKVRKIHNILFVPDFESAERINGKLATLGNIESDGRPILGLDSRNLLEILLEKAPEGFLVPAHIWTPWFSLFGSKSGFNTIEECFGDLTENIFALETGLSSDPDMNRLVSSLDKFSLISNSDCHSPSKLGREANLFDTELSFYAIRDGLKTPANKTFCGTIEFYPEEGKYHYDGHRKCGICFDPFKTKEHKGICPVCGRPLVIGVTHRVMELADRKEPTFGDNTPKFHSLIPLPEVIGEILALGPATKGVMTQYSRIINLFGSEFNLLLHTPIEEISERYSSVLAEAVQRIRMGKVIRHPGYDGEFGVIKVFEEGERDKLAGQISLFSGKKTFKRKKKTSTHHSKIFKKKEYEIDPSTSSVKKLNPEQHAAVNLSKKHCIISAGPGTGKTFTLVSRIAHLINVDKVNPDRIAAITFTNRAANEVQERLVSEAGEQSENIFIGTFHSFCLFWLRQNNQKLKIIGEEARVFILKKIFPDLSSKQQKILIQEIKAYFESLAAEKTVLPMLQIDMDTIDSYLKELEQYNTIDLNAVIPLFVQRLQEDPSFQIAINKKIDHLFIDEFQDLNASQYQLIKLISQNTEIFAIGDPDQAIYGFRGSNPEFFFRFINECNAEVLYLTHNYRSAPAILKAAESVICNNPLENRKPLISHNKTSKKIELFHAATPQEEAEFVVRRIEEVMGGISHFSINTGRGGKNSDQSSKSFGDIAILYRLSQQATILSQALERRGIPFQIVDTTPFFMQAQLRAIYYLIRIADDPGDNAEHIGLLKKISGIGNATIKKFEQALLLSNQDFQTGLNRLDLSKNTKKIINQLHIFIRIFEGKVAHSGLTKAVKYAMEWLHIDCDTPDAKRLYELGAAFGSNLNEFSNYLKNNATATVYDEKAEAVSLMTMHAAKGLEFPIIFITGVEEGLLPCMLYGHEKENKTDVDVEEERRLFYVGMTRAKENLVLSSSATRTIYGKNRLQEKSRFISEIPQQLMAHIERRPKKKKKQKAVQMKLF